MTLKTKEFKGRIKKGNTEMACTITVERVGPLKIRLKSGTYTHTDGTALTLSTPKTITMIPCSTCEKFFQVMLYEKNDGTLGISDEQTHSDGTHENNADHKNHEVINFKRWLSPIVFCDNIPANASDMDDFDIFFLQVVE